MASKQFVLFTGIAQTVEGAKSMPTKEGVSTSEV